MSDKKKLRIHQSSRKRLRLRLRDHMMTRRSRETQDCLLNLAEKPFWRKLRVFEELAC